jgi:hypothetical protein
MLESVKMNSKKCKVKRERLKARKPAGLEAGK